ncbi:OsmC family peroxiredoxin [Candidatus Thorarchaeota archaeon]|nr:MAG: OsmC family peroxiredoxin [Candidatus Thorarchaeota archaeon]
MKIKTKYPEKMEYIAHTEWDGKTGGTAKLRDTELIFDTPEVYGGRGQGLCPYRLFIAGVLGCINNTFLDIQRMSNLDLISFKLSGKLIVQFDGEGYSITKFLITGEVVVAEDDLFLGERCIEQAKKYCPLTRSTKDCIPIIYEIELTGEER